MDETDLGQLPVGKPLSRDLIGDHALASIRNVNLTG
jgi:hypothetical protein